MNLVLEKLLNLYEAVNLMFTWTLVLQLGMVSLFTWMLYTQFIRVYLSPLRKIPGANFYPFLGNLPELLYHEIEEQFERWMINHKDSPLFRYYWLFGVTRIMVIEPDPLKFIMVTHSKNFRKSVVAYKKLKMVLGNGLVTSEGEEHLMHRKLCSGSFKIKVLKNMIPVFEQCACHLTNNWKTAVRQNSKLHSFEIPVHADLPRLTLDVIGKCAFGFDFGALSNSNQDTVAKFKLILQDFELSWKMLIPFYDWLPTQNNRQFVETMSKVNEIVYSVIAKKRSELNKFSDVNKCTDLLSCLLLARDEETDSRLSDTELRDQVLTFMLAGHETTSVAMTWFLLQMASYPDIQKKVQQEVTSVLPQDGQPITYEHLEKLTYLTCVLKETLRLYPPVPITVRETICDEYISGYLIPKGTIISLGIGALHRHPKFWTDPLEFKPERFLDESSIHSYSYMPFIAGSRMCLGYKFALMEMQTVLAFLMCHFTFSLIPGITFKRRIVLTTRPEPPLVLQVSEVNL